MDMEINGITPNLLMNTRANQSMINEINPSLLFVCSLDGRWSTTRIRLCFFGLEIFKMMVGVIGHAKRSEHKFSKPKYFAKKNEK